MNKTKLRNEIFNAIMANGVMSSKDDIKAFPSILGGIQNVLISARIIVQRISASLKSLVYQLLLIVKR